MKKHFLTIATCLTLGFGLTMNSTAKADCATDLVTALNDNINNQFLAAIVYYGNDGTVYVAGPAVGSAELNAIIDQYNTDAMSCPTAHPLVVVPNNTANPSRSTLIKALPPTT